MHTIRNIVMINSIAIARRWSFERSENEIEAPEQVLAASRKLNVKISQQKLEWNRNRFLHSWILNSAFKERIVVG